jgi:hypothetical protein
MASKRFKAVVLDVEDSVMSRHALPDYEDVGPVTGDRKAFWPVTGWRIRPTFMFELRSGAR